MGEEKPRGLLDPTQLILREMWLNHDATQKIPEEIFISKWQWDDTDQSLIWINKSSIDPSISIKLDDVVVIKNTRYAVCGIRAIDANALGLYLEELVNNDLE
jgi:hypothetical protein